MEKFGRKMKNQEGFSAHDLSNVDSISEPFIECECKCTDKNNHIIIVLYQ